MRLLLLVVISVAWGACGGRPPVPKRLVVEGDVGSWKFRRFQGPLLDIEVWVEGNKGEAYSASYITASSEKIGHIADKDLVNVTVTKYERRDGIVRETVRLVRRLAAEKGYQVNEKKTKGVRGLVLTGPNETWMMWPSGNYVVKVGGQGRETVPDQVIASYGNRYPSQLPGGSLEGPLPPGPEDKPKTEPKEQYDPKNPKPDIDKYDPKKVKIPERKVDTTGPETEGTGDADKKERDKKKKDEKKDKKKEDKKAKKNADDDEKPKSKKKDADDDEKPKKKKKDAEDDEEKPKKTEKKDKKDKKEKKKKVEDDEE